MSIPPLIIRKGLSLLLGRVEIFEKKKKNRKQGQDFLVKMGVTHIEGG